MKWHKVSEKLPPLLREVRVKRIVADYDDFYEERYIVEIFKAAFYQREKHRWWLAPTRNKTLGTFEIKETDEWIEIEPPEEN